MNGFYNERNIAICILLTIVTCGLYGIYWFICLNDETLRTTQRQGMSGGIAFLFCIVTCGLFSIYWAYKMGDMIDSEKRMRGIYTNNSTGILYLILDLFGLGIIAWALLQNELNDINRGPSLENGY